MVLPEAIGYIKRNIETCSGCRTCEAVCSLSHEGVVSRSFLEDLAEEEITHVGRYEVLGIIGKLNLRFMGCGYDS